MLTVTTENGMCWVSAPYHPDFVAGAHGLKGEFFRLTERWCFDGKLEAEVRDLCMQVYGCDGTLCETVTVRVRLTRELMRGATRGRRGEAQLFFLGRMIAERRWPSEAVRLGEDVALVSGGFARRAGSMAGARLDPHDDTVLEVMDVPAAHPQIGETMVVVKTDLDTHVGERTV